MKFLEKYLLILFLIANATAEYKALMNVSKLLFYVVLGLSAFAIFRPEVTTTLSRRRCPWVYVIMIASVMSQFVIRQDFSCFDNITFTITKVTTLCVMILCISTNFVFYFEKTIIPFAYVIVLLVGVGWFHNKLGGDGSSDYIVFGFANRNAACTLASIGFAGFLFARDKYKIMDLLCMGILILTILVGGSRNALAMCILSVLVRCGLSRKLIVVALVSVMIVFFILPNIGVQTTAADRLIETARGEVSMDREKERKAAIWMIKQKPWTGHGYVRVNYGYALKLTKYGAHNGYITFIEIFGLPLGITIILALALGSLKKLKLYFLNDCIVNYHLAVIISLLFAANQEDFLIGVNSIVTNMFFVSFIVLSIYQHDNYHNMSIA